MGRLIVRYAYKTSPRSFHEHLGLLAALCTWGTDPDKYVFAFRIFFVGIRPCPIRYHNWDVKRKRATAVNAFFFRH